MLAKDIYGNDYVPPEYSGYEDENFDGTEFLENLLGSDEDPWVDLGGGMQVRLSELLDEEDD